MIRFLLYIAAISFIVSVLTGCSSRPANYVTHQDPVEMCQDQFGNMDDCDYVAGPAIIPVPVGSYHQPTTHVIHHYKEKRRVPNRYRRAARVYNNRRVVAEPGYRVRTTSSSFRSRPSRSFGSSFRSSSRSSSRSSRRR